ncbi:hypothetical protein OAO18_08140, partial [Francisellaceae bacterium]|nr:hypothetical protein [Francisellaceae bacterium]
MSAHKNYQVTPLPEFSKVKNDEIVPTVNALVDECRNKREQLLNENTVYTWNNLVLPIDEQEEKLSQMFSPVQHLNMVANSPELREAYEASINILTEYASEVGQNKQLYEAYKYVYENDVSLDSVQKKALKDILKGFEHSGVALPEKERQRFKEIKSELSKIANKFENNVLDATMGWEYHTEDKSKLAGLSEDVVSAAENKAKSKGKTGYVLGLDMPTYLAIMMTCDNRKLRETFYVEYCTRASDQGSN